VSLTPEEKELLVCSIMEQVVEALSDVPADAVDGVLAVSVPGLSEDEAAEVLDALNAATAFAQPLGGIII
jgi:hypothetical protein